jgi:hypothetical protein
MLPTEFERLLQKSIQIFRIQEKIRIRILGTCNRVFECNRIFLKMYSNISNFSKFLLKKVHLCKGTSKRFQSFITNFF